MSPIMAHRKPEQLEGISALAKSLYCTDMKKRYYHGFAGIRV